MVANLFDPHRRSDDILKVLETENRWDIERHIGFYEACLERKNDPFLPTYRMVIQKLKAKL
jgi:hypothetical protein